MDLYQSKLMVLHAAYKVVRGDDFRSEVSMAKNFVAKRAEPVIVDRAVQDHGALGFSKDTPLADLALNAAGRASPTVPTRSTDEDRRARIAAYRDHGSTAAATGALPI